MATTLFHPTITDHAVDVPDAQVDAWLAQGWRKTQPKPTPTTDTAADAAKK